MNWKYRIFDLFVLILGFPAFFFLFLLLTIIGLRYFGFDLFFVQERAGLEMKTFSLLKFRTIPIKEAISNYNWEDPFTGKKYYLPQLVIWVRESGLDELPQILNILKGEMSWVGPRPLPVIYNTHYSSYQKKRFDYRPGMTGLAQLDPNIKRWSEYFEEDVRMNNEKSLFNDLKILWLTFKSVLLKSERCKINEPFGI